MASKHRWKGYLVLGIGAAALLAVYVFFPQLKSSFNPEHIREFLLGFGSWSYLVFFALLALSIPLPIPSAPIAIAGGYLFGTFTGMALSLAAAIAGSTVSFFLARKLGKDFLLKMVHEHHFRHFLHIFKRRGMPSAIVSYAIPVFPSDSVSLILGFAGIKFTAFLLAVTVGHIPRYLLLSALGDDFHTGFSLAVTAAIVLAALAFILITLFREKVKRLLFREIRELEHEAKVLEKGAEKEARVIEKDVLKEEKVLERDVRKEARWLEMLFWKIERLFRKKEKFSGKKASPR